MLTRPRLDHSLRRGRITSSVAAGCLGLSPYLSPADAWARILEPEAYSDDGNPDCFERGNILEPTLLDWASEKLGQPYVLGQTVTIEDWAADTVDGVLADGNLLECKTVSARASDGWGNDGTEDVPDFVKIQCYWHMHHYPQAKICYVPFLGDWGLELRCYQVARHQPTIDTLVSALRQWHAAYVVTKTRPPGAMDSKVRDRMAARSDTLKVMDEVPDELAGLVADYLAAKQAEEAAHALKSEAREAIKDAMGRYKSAKTDAWGITYGTRKGSARTDWKAAALELGITEELKQQHTSHGHESRVLVIRAKGG
jgi:putative phage-type endonuclease